jgi:diguanylate cyclase (GGDEF)-like protein/PAS domain S-box-containing protein
MLPTTRSTPRLTVVPPIVETPIARVSRHAWLIYLGGMSAVSLAYLFAPKPINSGPVFNAIGLSAVVAIVVGIRINRIPQKLPWVLFALAQALFVAGDVIAYNYQRFFGRPLPYPSVADGLYLAVYPALVAGILLLIRRRLPGRDTAGLLDSLVITLAAGLISWVFLIAPYEHDATLTLPTKLTSIAYPVMDILVLSAIVRLAFGGGRRDRSFILLLLASVSLLVTDSVYGWLLLHGGYETGGLLDGGWIAFYLLLGAAALHPSVASLAETSSSPETRLTPARLALLATAALTAPLVRTGEFAAGTQIDVPLISAVGAVMYLLVVARMAGLMRRQERSEARFSSLVRNSSDVVTVIGADLTVIYASASVERVLGYTTAEIEGTNIVDLVHPDERAGVLDFLESAPEGASPAPAHVELTMRHRDGRWLEVETLRTNLLDDPAVRGIVLNTRDISERKAVERQLEHHAFYDTVTGLANRALFRDRVDHALAQAQRTSRTVAVMFMDLDDFKVVNDTFGHPTGDALLKAVGTRLLSCLRAGDTAARLGGDEFAILLEETDEAVDPAEIAERIMRALESPFVVDGRELRVGASLGIAYGNSNQGERATEELLRNADVAMYTAKGQGKSRHAVYQPTMHKTMLQRLELKGDIQKALERNEFVLHYQPLVSVETTEISGLEALVRWQHPERGMISPAEFIPLAEETGLIIPLGSWVLETACCEARRLQQRYPQQPPLSMSVNLSSRQLQWPGIVGAVKRALKASGLEPGCLTLEVTESAMVRDVELSVLRLEELKALGVRLAIDDFGSGYSSLSYIRRFPVDTLKIDKSFIDFIDNGGEELALTAAIIDLARTLHLRPVAEGVERPEQYERLLALGCDLAQGYFFAKPGTTDAIEGRISQERGTAAA